MSEPLKSYGPDGEIIAFSYDGGDKWVQVPKNKKDKPLMKEYVYKIGAVAPVNGSTPSFERRIVNSFAPLGDAHILAGWGPFPHIQNLAQGSLDGIVIPFGTIEPSEMPEAIELLRKVARKIFVDIDSTIVNDRSFFKTIVETAKSADALLVPTDPIAMMLRSYNANTYCIPPTINASIWRGVKREPYNGPVRIAVQHTSDRHIQDAVSWMMEKYKDQVVVVTDEWQTRSIYDDADFYTHIDVVIAGSPPDREQSTPSAVLPAMVGGCCIVGDVSYSRTLMHGHSALLVAEKGPSPWRKQLSHAVTDSRTRVKMQAGARERSRLFTGRTLLNRLALPYRVVLG